MIIGHLVLRLRSGEEAARRGMERTGLIHTFTEQLATVRGQEGVLRSAVSHIGRIFASDVAVFMPHGEGPLEIKARSEEFLTAGGKEHGVAQWVYDSGEPAGLGTESLPVADALYVPLRGSEEPVGVLVVRPHNCGEVLAPDQRLLLDSFAHQIVLALEVDRLQANARKTEVEMETERLRSSLLSSVSHDLRTPLAAIVGSAGALLNKEGVRDNPSARELLENIQAEGEALARLVQKLLDVTRLESGSVSIHKELYPLEEVVGSALERLKKILKGREVVVSLPEDLQLVPLDAILVEQVFINLLENAARLAPVHSRIHISAREEAGSVTVEVADEGPGLKKEELERVFDKFYHGASSPGAGLGLAICRAVVNTHGGRIWAENRPTGGAVFRFTLPLQS